MRSVICRNDDVKLWLCEERKMQDYEYIIRGGIGSRGSWLLCDMGSVPDSGGCGMELESMT